MSTAGSKAPENEETRLPERLAALLTGEPYGLQRVGRVAELWPKPADAVNNGKLIVEPRLRVARYLDLNPALLIVDARLGTLGLVFQPKEDVSAHSERILDQATYLRHLLMMEAGADARPARRAYSVECVVIMPSHGAQEELKEVFRTTARETSFWHAMGVNVLVCAEGATPSAASLRRAFSWLLAATRRWFADRPPTPERRLTSMTLQNYRLPGRRTWTFEQGATVHLLHGQNGTGKSSLAEALELSVTGAAIRLQARGVTDYDAVIRNRQTTDAARIALGFAASTPWASAVTASGVHEPLKRGIPVSRFRLDQDAMDDLARRGPMQRAEVFLGSFFPDDRGVTAKLNKARADLDAIVRTLPPDLQAELQSLSPDQRVETIKSKFAWVNATRPPTLAEADVCRPLSRESLEALRLFSSPIEEYVGTTTFESPADFDRRLFSLNEELERIRGRAGALVEAIEGARHYLADESIRAWRPAGRGGAVQEWLTLLEKFSENVALADLAEKHLQVSETLTNAGNDGWIGSFEAQPAAGLFLQPPDTIAASLDALRKLREHVANERKALSDQLVRSTQADSSRDARRGTAAPELTARQVNVLNLAGEVLAGHLSTEKLGRVLEQAFSQNETIKFGPVTIGESEDWAARLDARIGAAHGALAHLRDESYVSPVQRRENLKAALVVADAVANATQDVKKMFLTELQNERFNEALNELMALFTPARWAYADVTIRHSVETSGKDAMELEIAGSKGSNADLLFNTAELNVFTLAMYLLAAVRIENPLGVLLFDDPLQNMDELTVTTVARGLAKVAAVFPAGSQLVFLFHGEDDLDRFRLEIPAAVYLLPWLAPAADASDVVTIGGGPQEKLKSTHDWQLQELTNVIVSQENPAQA